MKPTYTGAIVVAALMGVSLAACTKPTPATPAVDTGKIVAAIKADAAELVTNFNTHDAVKSVAHDAPDMVGMFHGAANVVGPAADLALTKQQVADPSAKITTSNETVDVAASGEMAVYRASYVYNFTNPKTKKPATEHGNWLIGYRQQPDGGWKIAWNVVSDTPATAAK